jgi:soluble cytochrome b562
MMAAEESVNDIVKSAQAARRSLSDLEQKLQSEIDSIDFAAFREGRDLTAAEIAKRTQLRASQGELRDAFVQLAFVTVSRLDDSAEVAALSGRMERINRGLADDLDRLKRVAGFAKAVAGVADGVAKVAARLVALAAAV